jgi:hypothetical protein
MLKLQRWGLLATLVAIATLLLIQGADSQRRSPRRQQQNPPQQTQQTPAPDQRGTEQSPFIVKTIPGPTDEAKAAEEAKERREKAELDKKLVEFNADLAFYTKILAGFAGLQFLALVIQAYWLARTVKVSEKAAAAAKESADAVVSQLRAYVFIKTAELANLDEPEPVTASVVLRNSGQTPAFRVNAWGGISYRPFPLTVPLPTRESPGGTTGSVADLAPGTDMHQIYDIPPLSEQQREALRAGTAAIYVYGDIRYVDAFKQERFCRYRYIFGGNMGTRIAVTDDGRRVGIVTPTPEGNEAN